MGVGGKSEFNQGFLDKLCRLVDAPEPFGEVEDRKQVLEDELDSFVYFLLPF